MKQKKLQKEHQIKKSDIIEALSACYSMLMTENLLNNVYILEHFWQKLRVFIEM